MKAPRHPCCAIGSTEEPFQGHTYSVGPPAIRIKTGFHDDEKTQSSYPGTIYLSGVSPVGCESVSQSIDDFPIETLKDDAHKEREGLETFLDGTTGCVCTNTVPPTTWASSPGGGFRVHVLEHVYTEPRVGG